MSHLFTRAQMRRTDRARIGSGWRAPTTCGHEGSLVQRVLGLAIFLKIRDQSTWIQNNSWALDLKIIPEHLDSEWSRSGPRAHGLRIILSTWTSKYFPSIWTWNIIELRLTLPKYFKFWFATFSWLGKSESMNVWNCCKLIATNLNLCLICTK